MKLYKVGDMWYVDALIEGKRIRTSTRCSIKAEAMVEARKIISGSNDTAKVTHTRSQCPTISEAVDKAMRTTWRRDGVKPAI